MINTQLGKAGLTSNLEHSTGELEHYKELVNILEQECVKLCAKLKQLEREEGTMKADEVITKLYNLILDEDKTDLLKSMMQNPLFAETPYEEDPQVKELRHKIFHSLEWKHNEKL